MSQNLGETLAASIRTRENDLARWFEAACQKHRPAFYSSVDIRDSGNKIAVVDCNLFPAGFNNLCEDDRARAANTVRDTVRLWAGAAARKILVLPENHTKNPFYVENIIQLRRMLEGAGFDVRVGWMPSLDSPDSEIPEHAHELTLQGHTLLCRDFEADAILLNNDLSAGYPSWLAHLSQPVIPHPEMGWHRRRKTDFFRFYNELVTEFAGLLGAGPETFTVRTETVDDIDFRTGKNLDRVREAAARILKPGGFAFLKNNAGTYGIGIHVFHDLSELESLNARERNKMSVGKGKVAIHSVIVQEGIPTRLKVGELTAEPVVYMVGGQSIGGFLRTHRERGVEENLNSPGAVFQKMCLKDPTMGVVYPWLGKLSALAAGRETDYSLGHGAPKHS